MRTDESREARRAGRGDPQAHSLEARTREIGGEILERSRGAAPSILHPDWWQQRILEWTMRDAALRTQLFRFVDVLPSLRTNAEVAEHLAEYLLNGSVALPAPLEHALHFHSPRSLPARVAAVAARRSVRQMARRFIAGETVREAVTSVWRLRRQRMSFTLDLLGEATTSESQADEYARRYLELIDGLTEAARGWPPLEMIDTGTDGLLPRVNVSLKLSALYSQFHAAAASQSAAAVGRRLRPILRRAHERGAAVNIDMEEYAHKDLVLELFKSILLEDEFRDFPHVGAVLQSYLPDTEGDMDELLDWVRRRGQPIAVRLVKGAYWDIETVLAAQRGWPSPVFTQKWETDAAFERLLRVLIENHRLVRPAIASHNVRSLASAIAVAEAHGLSARNFEIQMLFGMGDPVKAALVDRGLHLRIYTPHGRLIPGMGYLIRRLLENTSNDSFLRQSFSEHAPVEDLLANPDEARPPGTDIPRPVAIDPDEESMAGGFANEPLSDFAVESNRSAMAAALRDVRERCCGADYPLIIGGQRSRTERSLDSVDPSHPGRTVGRVSCAAVEHADLAVAAAREAWPMWGGTPVAERTELLRRLADQMRRRRFELAAWIAIEAGKPWIQADADVAEAIDFCAFYAADMERRARRPRQRHVPGERNTLVYEPRGVAAIIAPWNFPLAILSGMATAALVTGNTVVVKPAEQSPVVAAKFFEMLAEVGFPAGVANFLPGYGEEVGARLVGHPDVASIAFTGSRAVGLQIIEAAARVQPGQRVVKRVIAEMGGKNAIVIDPDADIDDAVRGVTRSAFEYAGQ